MKVADYINPIGGFLLRHWIWIACAALIALAWHNTGRIKDLSAERDAAEASAKQWEAAFRDYQALAMETARAREAETAQVLVIRDQTSQAIQDIQNAPGADDEYVYSDDVYRLMQQRPEAAPQ